MTEPMPVRPEPPINIHIHSTLGPGDRARLLKALKETHMPATQAPHAKAPPAKAGWKTTEFWATILLNVGVAAAAGSSNLPPRYAAIASAVSVSAYAFSRALAKM